VCSNRAATHTNILQPREKYCERNARVCRDFENSRNLQQTIVLTSHGRGRWFEPVLNYSPNFRFMEKRYDDKAHRDLSRPFVHPHQRAERMRTSGALTGFDTNPDTNPHEQRRTRAMRQQEKYTYLQGFLNTGEQPRHNRPAIPLNGVSRVRIPPPPLGESLICRKNVGILERR
jgi:hypothetical protein